MDSTPYTERSNSVTENVDVSSPSEMVQLLRRTDQEIFTGVTTEIRTENLLSENVVKEMTKVGVLIRDTLSANNPKDVAIVLGGCGTSGRLGYSISRVFNELSAKIFGARPFFYSIAGGDKSILTSQEAPEDDPSAGVVSLLKICSEKRKVIYVGITCGLSAPFVGGQLEHCMKHLDVFTPVLLGFNPVQMARNVSITGWDLTMRDVSTKMQSLSEKGKGFIINPVLGAEPITGSSRMKGGSATKIILEAMFLSALNSLETESDAQLNSQNMSSILKLYQTICCEFYQSNATDVMSNLIQRCGESLTLGGAVRYLASGWMGVIPLIDSTECPPTFGSSVNDVRGFVDGGYDFLGIEDFGKESDNFRLGLADFVEMCQNSNIENDAVIGFIQSKSDPILTSLRQDLGLTLRGMRRSKSTIGVVLQKPNSTKILDADTATCFDEVLYVTLPEYDHQKCETWGAACKLALEESLYGCCLKWMVNAASTGGHVLLGKVYKNYMCDVKVSNNKLFHRSIGIIKKLCPEVSHDVARSCLLKSIYETDEITDAICSKTVAEHHKAASPKEKIVPLAIILAKKNCTVELAKETLKRHSIIRNAVLEVTAQ